jgi:hypothetical protein
MGSMPLRTSRTCSSRHEVGIHVTENLFPLPEERRLFPADPCSVPYVDHPEEIRPELRIKRGGP